MKNVRDYLELIKFVHTIFALPSIYLGKLLVAGEILGYYDLFWISVAMAAARTIMMRVNRKIEIAI